MSITALIVDDEELAREELKYLLDTTGSVDVLGEGKNGVEAVDLIRTHHPDVVFLDVQMPGLDGFAVLKKLLELGKGEQLPQIIFATAFDQYAVRAFDVNAIDYLLKPFDRDRVLQAVERARLRLQEAGPSGEAKPAPADLRVDTLLRLIEQHQAPKAAQRQDCAAGGQPPAAYRSEGHLLCLDRRRGDFCGDADRLKGSRSAALWRSCSTCSIPRSSGARTGRFW